MFDVYRNAFVTLAAGWGDSSASGLFSASQNELVAELSFKYHRWPLHAFKSHSNYGDWAMGDRQWKEPSPLFTRAWTYQERLISPRVTVPSPPLEDDVKHNFFKAFSSRTEPSNAENETDWELEGFEDLDESHDSWSDCSSDLSSCRSSYRSEPDGLDIKSFWRKTVRNFHKLQLSFESDRLPAIGAIAQQISKHRPSELYLAGLWSGSLLNDLIWYRARKSAFHRRWVHTDPGMSQDAPSWSWAFCGHEVDWVLPGKCLDLTGTNKVEIIDARYISLLDDARQRES
ncbi:hypothetical protein ANO14919_045670 [Xylariales sp. No.14919]|nr:hypothetical protein ANO14919_045670 [Xylariales sp. No.14919]